MKLTDAKRRRMAARAAKLLKRKTVTWSTGHWIRDKATGVKCDPDKTMGEIRQWFKNRGLDTYNKECSVCLEGALLLSAIEDRDIPDEMHGMAVLRQFRKEITTIGASHVGDLYSEIPSLNDAGMRMLPDGQKVAIAILEEAGRPVKKASDGD